MAQAINCNYSRTAIRVLCQEEFAKCGVAKCLPYLSLVKVVEAYNRHFSEQGQCMNLSLAVAKKRVHPLLTTFNKRWNLYSQKTTFLDVFSLTSWNQLPLEEKNKHTLQQCSECHTQHLSLTKAFPDKKDRTMLQHQMPVTLETSLMKPFI